MSNNIMYSFKKGFTIIEILIVIVVLGILGSLGLKTYLEAIQESKINKTIEELGIISSAIGNYKKDTGFMPCDLQFLYKQPTVSTPTATQKTCNITNICACNQTDFSNVFSYWRGPYLKDEQIKDNIENATANSYELNGIGKTNFAIDKDSKSIAILFEDMKSMQAFLNKAMNIACNIEDDGSLTIEGVAQADLKSISVRTHSVILVTNNTKIYFPGTLNGTKITLTQDTTTNLYYLEYNLNN